MPLLRYVPSSHSVSVSQLAVSRAAQRSTAYGPNPFDYEDCIQLAGLAPSDKLAGELCNTPPLKARCLERGLVRLKNSIVACKRCAVGISGFELNRVGITQAHNNRPPVVKRHVQADNCRFLAAVLSGATGK